jgi:hypothetical protein
MDEFQAGADMTRGIRGFLWFFLFCGFFSLAFTSAYEIADALLLAFLVTGLIVATGMKLWNMWKYRSDPQMFEAHISSGQGGLWGPRWRRWALDEHDHDKDSK